MSATFQHVRQFAAAPRAGFSDEDAETYGAFLADAVGLGTRPVSAEEILEAARPRSSPIHARVFDKNQRDAAHEYYVERARWLVRHIVVCEEQPDGTVETTRAFHHVVASDEDDGPVGGYVSERVVWRDPDLASQVIHKAMTELRGWSARWKQYEALGPVVAVVDEALKQAA